ncbi:MAG: hypothetical protein QOK19_2611 [Solirubrobacteraceae bacterium]|jgi:ketosteroid isomerase-like protein|nr:hypothetical protein [Solirubrobacterales bacterium]MEA2217050.1 hypothetical protein [Solirubrobacteraceae bacterium]
MSRENVEIVKRGVEDVAATGKPPWALLDEDIETYDHDTPDQGAYMGHAGYGRWLEDWEAAWGEWTIEPEEYVDAGDSVVVVIRMRATGRGSGLELSRQDAMVFKLRNGLVIRLDYYNDRAAALNAVGLAG